MVFHIYPYTLFFWSTCISNDPGPEFFVEVCLNLKLWYTSKLLYPMDPESSLYIISALAHQKYTLSDRSFREIKHNTVPWNLFFNKHSGAVVTSPNSTARRCRRSRCGFEPYSTQWYFIFLPIHFFSEVLASVMILGRNSLLKFV